MRAFALLMLLPAIASAEKPKPFESTEDGYRIAFPKEPTKTEKKLATSAGALPVNSAKLEVSKELVFSVTVTTYPETFRDVTPAKLFDGVRDGFKGADGKVIDDKEITLAEKYSGRDVTIDAGKNTIRARLILVDRKLYQVMAVGLKEKTGSAAADDFFKSFELLK